MRRSLSLLIAALPLVTGLAACNAQQEAPGRSAAQSQTQREAAPPPLDPSVRLAAISPAIPVYAGAELDRNLTRRDNTTVSNRYGDDSRVYTLSTRDSFPQVWHYYVTYLAQFRGFEPVRPFPPSNQVARSIEVRLNDAMQDPFIPGDTLGFDRNRVILQVAEADGGAGTIIRYIVGPPQPRPVSVADASMPGDAPLAAGAKEQVEGP